MFLESFCKVIERGEKICGVGGGGLRNEKDGVCHSVFGVFVVLL